MSGETTGTYSRREKLGASWSKKRQKQRPDVSFLDRNEPITTSVQQPGRFLSVGGCALNQLTEWKAIRQEREPTSWGG